MTAAPQGMIPGPLARELEKLIRDRDTWKRRALERSSTPSVLRRRYLAGRDVAVRELLFLAEIEGMNCLSRGGKGCVFRAVEALRPDIARVWQENGEAGGLLRRFFPDGDE